MTRGTKQRQRGFLLNPFRFEGGGGPAPTGAYRYWRLSYTASQNNGFYCRIGEIELYDEPAGTNLATSVGGTASASDPYYPAARAFDGGLAANSADFIGQSYQGWVQLDFGAGNAQEVGHIKVINSSTASGGEQDQFVRNYIIEASNNAADWDVMGKRWGQPYGSEAASELVPALITELGHRYWRIYITANDGSTYTAAADIELLESDYNVATGIGSNATANSSTYGAPSAAFDQTTSPWVTDAGVMPAWIAIDLKQPAVVSKVAITAQGGSPDRSPKDFSVQWSDNGTDWTTVATITGQTGWTSLEKRTFNL